MTGTIAAEPGATQPGRDVTVIDVLPRAALLRLLGVLLLVLAPHVTHVPIWSTALVLGVTAWRALAAQRGWRMLSKLARTALSIAAFAATFATFGRISGQTAGVSLLVVMTALKLTELRTRRDLMVLVFLLYFLLVTHFLFSQELWTAAYLIACAVFITGLLIDANHPESALPLKLSLRLGSRMVLAALPLMAVIFVLFPRIPGPLWGLPSDSGAERSGLSDRMAPGDISDLLLSDRLAFRVRFEGAIPSPRERYWRGPVFGHFDGRGWDAKLTPLGSAEPAAALQGGPGYRYEITLEPQRSRWLFALDLPRRETLPADTAVDGDYTLLSREEVRERRLYTLDSITQYRLEDRLSDEQRAFYLRLPAGFDPRSRALAKGWRDQGLSGDAIVSAALKMFREEKFYYTLKPPALGHDSVDEFLFQTRRGFCEHYAGSFAVLMRAAGLPARVVTGYQGGQKNEVGDYYLVKQSDAHAWTEVWLGADRGWVRFDPTAAVAPDRVIHSVGDALSDTDDLPGYLDPKRNLYLRLQGQIEARWDWVNSQWQHWVLAYGPELQQEFLRHLGLADWTRMVLALTFSVTFLLGLTGLILQLRARPRVAADAAQQAWRRLQRRLARKGLEQAPGEGPQDFVARVARSRPEVAAAISAVLALYLRLRYLQGPEPEAQMELSRAVARVRL